MSGARLSLAGVRRCEAGARVSARDLLAAGGGLIPVVPLWLWWALAEGGYPAFIWLAGLVYLALAGTALWWWLPSSRPSGARLAALSGVGMLAAWGFASIIWATDKGAAWTTAERLALFALALALPLLWPPPRRALRVGVLAFVAVASLAAAAAVVTAWVDPGSLDAGRLIAPTGYPNATAALLVAAALPALVLAARRELGDRLRVLALAGAGTLLATSLLAQSRGAAIAGALALVAVLAVVPNRLRALVPVAITLVGLLAVARPVLAVHAAAVNGDASDAVAAAVAALAGLFVALAVAGWAYVRLDRRLVLEPSTVKRWSRAVAAGFAAIAAAAGVWFVSTQGSPVRWVEERAASVATPNYAQLEAEPTRFGGDLGSNRVDYWRVSLEVFGERPVLGAGAGSFHAQYLERRTSEKAPLYAHSVWLGTLAELGVPGIAALLLTTIAILVAAGRALRGAAPPLRALLLAAFAPLGYLTIHSSFDWVSQFPVLLVPALGLAAAAIAGSRPDQEPGRDVSFPSAQRARAPIATLAVCGGLVAATAGLPVLASAWMVDHARASWPERPLAALAELRRAGEINPLSTAPAINEGIVALQLDDQAGATAAFERAIARDGGAWFPRFELGLIAARSGDQETALARIAEAQALNPAEPLLIEAGAEVAAGGAPDPRVLALQAIEAG